MFYLFIGDDFLAKDQKISEAKKKALPTSAARQLDCETLYAEQCSRDDLIKSFVSLPVASAKRLVIVRNCHKLKEDKKEAILTYLKRKDIPIDVILDFDEEPSDKNFLKTALSFSQVLYFKTQPVKNLFDMTNAMSARKPAEALKNLSELLKEGNHPLQVLGGMIWFWGKKKGSVSGEYFRRGLLAIAQADLNIKRSKIEPQYALEILVLKLCSLIAC